MRTGIHGCPESESTVERITRRSFIRGAALPGTALYMSPLGMMGVWHIMDGPMPMGPRP